jgi:two-component system chemotaxis response regulator CheY
MRFLVVDDDFQARSLMQRLLHPYGLTEVATDGEEAVEAFRLALEQGEPYDLITLDILMPNVDGQEALREIREVEKEMRIPEDRAVKVIMVSGLDDAKEVHDAFFLGGATSYLVKPVHNQALFDEIAALGLSLSQSS